jgi:hypothetical protein
MFDFEINQIATALIRGKTVVLQSENLVEEVMLVNVKSREKSSIVE